MKEVIVIGCGPSGMMAAISAALSGAKVTVLDHMKSGGKKLLLTGNGRCNLTNLDPAIRTCYHSSCPEKMHQLIDEAFSLFGPEKTREFFMQIGLPTIVQDELVYPRSEQAESVLSALQRKMCALGVRIKYNIQIESVTFDSMIHRWKINLTGWAYEADALILACGSKAYAQTGSDGSGYELASALGHKIETVYPSLTALLSCEKDLAGCFGARTRSRITLMIDGQYTAKCEGQLQWLRNGLSGIPVFQLSADAAQALGAKKKVAAQIDLLPEWTENELTQLFETIRKTGDSGRIDERMLSGYLPMQILPYLFGRAKITSKNRAAWTEKTTENLVHLIKHLQIRIDDVRDFEQAQVCRGGVALERINPDSLESVIHKGLYFAGEILDIDGPCGGYNLQWAWSSGFLAGKCAAEQ